MTEKKRFLVRSTAVGVSRPISGRVRQKKQKAPKKKQEQEQKNRNEEQFFFFKKKAKKNRKKNKKKEKVRGVNCQAPGRRKFARTLAN